MPAALLALVLPACNMVEMPTLDSGSGSGTGGISRGEKCELMYRCGRENCMDESLAVFECVAVACSGDELEQSFILRAECLESNGCNTTDCDLVEQAVSGTCSDPADDEVVNSAIDAIVSDDHVANCVSLR